MPQQQRETKADPFPSRRLETNQQMAPGTDRHPNDHALEKFQANFWAKQISVAEAERPDAKHAILPLARIKKVMKSDPDVKVCICPSAQLLNTALLNQNYLLLYANGTNR